MSDGAEHSAAWEVTPDRYAREHPPRFSAGCQRTSRYVSVRDGTRLAVDVHLPLGAPAGERFPTLVLFTPYYRRFELRTPHQPSVEPSPNTGQYRDFFVPRGYAVVVVDVRGTGASFGSRDGFRSPVERRDSHDVVDWVASQPWSSSRIGAIGVSYVGAAADFLASTGHPAVKAVVPAFSVWDTYRDHYYPGGVLLTKLAGVYGELMEALDRDRRDLLAGFAYFADPHYEGPAPVDEDADGRLLAAALADHVANFDMTDFIHRFEFADSSLSYDPDYTSAEISPYRYAAEVAPDTAYLCVSGWLDGGGFANGAISRYLSLKVAAKRLLIGPWDHGARTLASPFRRAVKPEFPLLAECLRFFDHYLSGIDTGLEREAPVHYFTMGEEAWKPAASWPIPETGSRTYYLGPDRTLTLAAPQDDRAADEYQADYAVGSGRNTRYERLFARAVEEYYGDWHGRDARMLVFTTPPLERDAELTGHPVATLYMASSEQDGALFVYLEDVDAQGACRYVTEGVFRALHRKRSTPPWNLQVVGPYHSFAQADAQLLPPGEVAELGFALFPTSWCFRRGHRIRVAIAAADRDHFARIPDGRPPLLRFFRSRPYPSRIELPLVARDHGEP